ncbi:hypothetical protein An14g02400 [Aspergillus niger]|uniref:Uncharacterized protein n=2 Tax=Aspergillus niger TaxID=5061 RepID=A2R2Y6_ASPNC|nr:hypothetical protein An14g02400 [Aspergillus niger]CAK41977.1 hypothetical protein An14g02400 [Aspergillus niger]
MIVAACLKAKSWGHVAAWKTPTRLKREIVVDHRRCGLIGDHEIVSYPAPIPHVWTTVSSLGPPLNEPLQPLQLRFRAPMLVIGAEQDGLRMHGLHPTALTSSVFLRYPKPQKDVRSGVFNRANQSWL